MQNLTSYGRHVTGLSVFTFQEFLGPSGQYYRLPAAILAFLGENTMPALRAGVVFSPLFLGRLFEFRTMRPVTSAPMSALPRGLPGYIALLRGNPNVRNLWAAQSVSQLGDRFNSVALLGLIISLMAFKICFLFSTGLGVKVELLMSTISLLLLVLIPILLIGACLLTLISASVKSVKEAQSYMSILMMLPLLPTIILMVNPVKNQLWMFAVPFLSQNQMIMKLVRGETIAGAEWATYLAAGFGLAALLWAIAASQYHREKLAISA